MQTAPEDAETRRGLKRSAELPIDDPSDEETAFFAAESFVNDQEHDEQVWATLDEGCNAACHSASWAARAERYFDMFGFQCDGTRNKIFT